MTIWIVTTGSSDIQLKTEDNWFSLSDKVWDSLSDNIFEPSPIEDEELWSVPARALGLAYSLDLEQSYQDLHFPIWDSFCQVITQDNININKIIVLLSDQSNLFDELQRYSIKCPYWKDTVTLQPIIKHYFQNKFPQAKLESIVLAPSQDSKGLDHWDNTLTLIQNCLDLLNYDREKAIYVSHQAGTPAISSALQFTSLAKFGNKVKFLVSNEYTKEAEIIDSSKYLRGLRIEQAKGLVKFSPGAALKIVENFANEEKIKRIKDFIDIFNLNRSLNYEEDEFSIESATQRIVDALELIGIFFNQNSYIQGITLLSAAQETFLKVAILSKIKSITVIINSQHYQATEVIEWNHQGLLLKKSIQQHKNEQKTIILKQLKFPIDKYSIKNDQSQFQTTNKNWAMFDWLKQLEPKFNPWDSLKWSCKYGKDRTKDMRNQSIHNLRGIEESEVIGYLLGYECSQINDVMIAYNQKIKTPFLQAIQLFNLPHQREKLTKELQTLADSLR